MGKRVTGKGTKLYLTAVDEATFTSADVVPAVIDVGAISMSREAIDTSDINKKSSIPGEIEYDTIPVNVYFEDDSDESSFVVKVEEFFKNNTDIKFGIATKSNPTANRGGNGNITNFAIAERSADEPMKASFEITVTADGFSKFTEPTA